MGKKLVAYFSASGTTKKTAEMVAEAAGADLYEITPAVAYTKADLNWMDKKSRSSVEMSDKKIRPEMTDTDAGIENYDEILLGFPIWCFPYSFHAITSFSILIYTLHLYGLVTVNGCIINQCPGLLPGLVASL